MRIVANISRVPSGVYAPSIVPKAFSNRQGSTSEGEYSRNPKTGHRGRQPFYLMNIDSAKRRLIANVVFRKFQSLQDAGGIMLVRGPAFQRATAIRLRRAVKIPRLMLWAFMMEGIETKNMVKTFVRKGKGHLLLSKDSEPTEEEIRQAIEQLKDLPKFLPFFVFITVPVPGVTEGYVLLAVSLEKWLGQRFSLLPSQFRTVFQKNKEEKAPEDTGV